MLQIGDEGIQYAGFITLTGNDVRRDLDDQASAVIPRVAIKARGNIILHIRSGRPASMWTQPV
jgi:hypothetical protein